jgi:hypothetical protein
MKGTSAANRGLRICSGAKSRRPQSASALGPACLNRRLPFLELRAQALVKETAEQQHRADRKE